MDTTFPADPTPLPSNLAVTPEAETMDDLVPTPDTVAATPAVSTSNGFADQSQAGAEAEVLPASFSLQPEAEEWPAEPEPHIDVLPASPPSPVALPGTSHLAATPGLPSSPAAELVRVPRDDAQTEFANCVRQRNYVGAFASVVSRLCQLEVITIIEDEDHPASPLELGQDQGLPGHRLLTRIDLLTGDITNILGKRFIENPDYKPIKDLHNQQVDKGLAIMKDNLQTLMSAFNSLKNLAGES